MGTRADFYIKTKTGLQWQGSIAWDGFPDGMPFGLIYADTETSFKKELKEFFSKRDDVTLPKEGWPWPWENSNTTDYAYIFTGKTVEFSNYGGGLTNAWEYVKLYRRAKTIEDAEKILKESGCLDAGEVCGALYDKLNTEIEALQSKRKPKFPEFGTNNFQRSGKKSGLITVHADGGVE